MNLERRTFHGEVRTSDETPGLFEAKVMRYGVLDDYSTIFDAEVFRESMEGRLPRITWGHDWLDPIGQYVDYKDGRDVLQLVGQLDLDMIPGLSIPAVPRAHQARAQLKSKTITDFSVGFRRGETYEDDDKITHFRTATLDEVALVLAGAVPGTELVGMVRSRMVHVRTGLSVPLDTLLEIARQKAAGLLTDEEAGIALGLAAGEPFAGPSVETGAGPGGATQPAPDVLDVLDGDALQALDTLGIGWLVPVASVLLDLGIICTAVIAVLTAVTLVSRLPPVQWLWRTLISGPLGRWAKSLVSDGAREFHEQVVEPQIAGIQSDVRELVAASETSWHKDKGWIDRRLTRVEERQKQLIVGITAALQGASDAAEVRDLIVGVMSALVEGEKQPAKQARAD